MSIEKDLNSISLATSRRVRVEQPLLSIEREGDSSHFEESAQIDADDMRGSTPTLFGAAIDSDEQTNQPMESCATLQAAKGTMVRRDRLGSESGNDIFLPAKMSAIPWPVHECVYRAFWIVFSAALGVPRETVKHVCGERIVGTQIYSAATYSVLRRDAVRLGADDVRGRLQIGIALLGDPDLWVQRKLESRYSELLMNEMLPACRSARDEIKNKSLPCQISLVVPSADLSICIGPDLAPKRPAREDQRLVTEVGHSHGFVYRREHKLHFAKNEGHDFADIYYDEQPFLELVIAVSCANPPLIEVEYEEKRHDDVVVSRILQKLKIKTESLFGDTQSD